MLMGTSLSKIADGVLRRCGEELFAECGLSLPCSGAQARSEVGIRDIGGMVEFSGPRVRGRLVLISNFGVFAQTRPPAIATPLSEGAARDWMVIRDWSGELANRLLGRVKNRLLSHDVDFQVSPPVSLSGRGLAMAIEDKTNAQWLSFGRGEKVVRVVFDFGEDPAAPPAKPSAERPAREGDVIEF